MDLSVGLFFGRIVGLSVGISVDQFVGLSVGFSVVQLVGLSFGLSASQFVGLSVGLSLGWLVGLSVGLSFGQSMDLAVCLSIGRLVGSSAGLSVGFFVVLSDSSSTTVAFEGNLSVSGLLVLMPVFLLKLVSLHNLLDQYSIQTTTVASHVLVRLEMGQRRWSWQTLFLFLQHGGKPHLVAQDAIQHDWHIQLCHTC